jgi:chitin disaccharide deacetylase
VGDGLVAARLRAKGQPQGRSLSARLLIINADDLGYDPEVTRGILQSMREGVVTSCTLMVNTPFSEEAARQAAGLAIGLHLNLARNPPVSAEFPAGLLSNGELVEARAEEISAQAAEAETAAQLNRLERLLGRPATHIDVHKHLHRNPNILEGVLRSARARALPLRALDAQMRAHIRASGVRTTDHFIGDAGSEAHWTLPRFEEELQKLPDGTVELMCHPGYRPSHTRSGYSAQREVELKTFLDPAARRALERAKVRLGGFGAL